MMTTTRTAAGAAVVLAVACSACSSATTQPPGDSGTQNDASGDSGSLGDATTDAPTDASTIPPPDAPDALAIPDPAATVLLRAAGRGVQIYGCGQLDGGMDDAGPIDAGYGWTFVAPEAGLFDDNGASIGNHYAGPTWELPGDGSKIKGAAQAKVTVDATAIPWLLLKVVTNSGTGLLAHAKFVQRLYTVGGLAPTTACDGSNAGTMSGVNYTAEYYFWGD